MAINISKIQMWLDLEDITFYTKDNKCSFSLGKKDLFLAEVMSIDEGKTFVFHLRFLDNNTKEFIFIKDSQYLKEALEHLLYLNYKTKFGTWEYDPSDGDIRMAIEIPLEDAEMTYKQFQRILNFTTKNALVYASEIKSILSNGKHIS